MSETNADVPCAPTYGDTEAVKLRAKAAAGDWAAVEEGLQAAPGWSDRFFLVEAVSRWQRETPPFLAAWTQARPDSALALTVRGAHAIDLAWAVRGFAPADEVGRAAFKEFERTLKRARGDLRSAASIDERDPTPAAYLVRVSRGLGDEPETVQTSFEEAVRRDPDCRYAHAQRLLALTPRWSGSDAEVFAFAREAASAAPEGSPRHTLVAMAHVEFACWSDESPGLDTHLGDDEVRREVHAAYERSLGSPHYRPDRMSLFDRSLFAFAFAWSGAEDDAAIGGRLLDEMNGVVPEYPWEYRPAVGPRQAGPDADWGHFMRAGGCALLAGFVTVQPNPWSLPIAAGAGLAGAACAWFGARSFARVRRARAHLAGAVPAQPARNSR
jgi:hypothetical protein